jgi:Flp pilus assembly protein TadD
MEAQTRAGAVTVRNPFSFRLENALISYTLYMGKALWPVRLAALYPYPAQGWPWWKALVCFLLLASITAVVVKYRERRYLACGWFWYLGTMVPMIGLVQVGNQAMADRYAYLPFIGFFVMAIWAISDALGHSRAKPVLLVVSCIALAVLATISYRQVNYWRDDFSLWSHTLAVTQHNFVAEDNFGFALINRGRYQEGITHFRAAAQIEPGDPVSQVNLGIDAQRRGEWDEAMRRYQKALHLTSDSAVKASAYANLGSIQYALGDYQKARENLQSAIKLEASYPFVFLDLGMIAERAGDWNTAVDFYQKYVKGEPSDLGYLLLSRALDHIGQVQQAKLAYQQAERSSADIKQAEKTVRKLVGE